MFDKLHIFLGATVADAAANEVADGASGWKDNQASNLGYSWIRKV